MEIKSIFDTITNIWIKPAKQHAFFPVSNFHVLTEDMDSGGGGRGWVGKCIWKTQEGAVRSLTNIYPLEKRQ